MCALVHVIQGLSISRPCTKIVSLFQPSEHHRVVQERVSLAINVIMPNTEA